MPRTINLDGSRLKELEDGKYQVTLPDSVVTEDELEANFVPKADHEALQERVQGRVETAKENAREQARQELLADQSFLEDAIDANPEFFKKRFPDTEVDTQQIVQQVRAEEVQPLKQELEETKGRVQELTGHSVQGAIERAMGTTGVRPEARDLVESHLRERTRWDPDYKQPVVVDAEGNVQKRLQDGEMRPMRPEEYAHQMRASGKYDFAFDSEVRSGSGFKGGGDVPPESLDDEIRSAEEQQDFARAGSLKAKKLQGMSAGQAGGAPAGSGEE